MPSRISAVAINVIDIDLIADFWCAALDWRRIEEDDDGVSIGPADGSWPTIDLWPVADKKPGVNRLHFDLRADGVTVEQELGRLIRLGATRVDVGQPADASWFVLADPEGNEFCLLSRTVQEVV